MKLVFIDSALAAYQSIKAANPELAEKIKGCLKDTIEHPDSGVGEPVRLEGNYDGVWERRLSIHDSIFYAFNADKVVIVSIVSNTQTSGNSTSKIHLTLFSKTDAGNGYSLHFPPLH